MTTISSAEAAKTICEISDWTITHLKVHKILYLLDIAKLTIKDERLIDEDFEAWLYGPVLPSLYSDLKIFGANIIKDIWINIDSLKKGDENYDLIYNLAKKLTNYSSRELVNLTHQENSAWKKIYADNKKSNVTITKELMREEYRSLIS